MKTNRLTALLYTLMRDEIPPGKMESFVRDAEKTEVTEFKKGEYSNQGLAKYAQQLAVRLMKAPRKPISDKQKKHLERIRPLRHQDMPTGPISEP